MQQEKIKREKKERNARKGKRKQKEGCEVTKGKVAKKTQQKGRKHDNVFTS
jgi:hypothetical protein